MHWDIYVFVQLVVFDITLNPNSNFRWQVVVSGWISYNIALAFRCKIWSQLLNNGLIGKFIYIISNVYSLSFFCFVFAMFFGVILWWILLQISINEYFEVALLYLAMCKADFCIVKPELFMLDSIWKGPVMVYLTLSLLPSSATLVNEASPIIVRGFLMRQQQY